ncbi:unnamed protein product [Cladocopium goreaui]|uniref:Uncharacterized protein n=1 Tax=Cladocopium goreaui TaxID=2562237 RepID=A0A9P1CD21_9DINO|nr:unnamed protein product [Cladocopium goreaui]
MASSGVCEFAGQAKTPLQKADPKGPRSSVRPTPVPPHFVASNQVPDDDFVSALRNKRQGRNGSATCAAQLCNLQCDMTLSEVPSEHHGQDLLGFRTKVEKSELPKKMDDLVRDGSAGGDPGSESQLSEFLRRFQAAVEAPLKSFSNHLKPALARRIHVGTMDYMGGSHEAYRRTFEFIEMTNTWFDLDTPTRAT